MACLRTGDFCDAENVVCVVMHRFVLTEECVKCVYVEHKNRRDVITHAEHSQKWYGNIYIYIYIHTQDPVVYWSPLAIGTLM